MKLFLFNNDEKLIGTVSPLEGIQNEEINKIQTIECTVVYSELIEKASYIGHKDYSDNRIFHLYKIDHVTKTSTTDVKIVGVHTFFDDMESDGYVKDFRPTNRELVGVLTTILDGSRWQLGTVNIQRRYTGNFYYVTRKEAISKLIEATQIEIKPRLEFSRGKITGRYLDVFTRLGARNGKVFVHGRDLLTVSEKKSQGAIYTAVVGRGKGEETDTGGYGRRISFKDVEWKRTSGQPVDKPVGQEYVEIPAMTKLYGFEKGTKPRIKIVEFQDETDKEKLLRLSYEWLEKNSRMQVEYSAKVLNVGNLELGDTVGIFNPKLGIKYETRVFKVKRNLVDNKLTEFGIGDKVTTSPFSRTIELAKEMKNFQDDTVYWLDKIRERLSDKLINEDGYNYDLKADNEYKVPAGYYSFDKPIDQNPTKVVYMGAGKIAIANSKKPTGEWNWKTFLDGRGATLDLINTGVLRAGRIQSADGRSYWDLDTGEFHMEQSAINEAVKTVVNGKVQEIVGEVKKNLPTKEELKGKSSYLHKKYSDYADGRNMSDNSTLKYIGIYAGEKQQAPTNASEYSWTKIRGEDGAQGRDGVSNYIHRKYSDNANGSPMSDNANLKYIGIYTGTSATAPTTPTSYTWSKIKGEDGQQGVPGARGSDGRTSYLHTAYSNSATGDRDFSTTNSTNKEYIGTYSDFEINDSNDYRRYKWVKIKGENGRDGNNGRDGRNGDSYTRNYLSGTADEKILTAVNDNFTTQEAFKLVDNKNFRDLGFSVGDKITFIADYEILPNGTNKKISGLNFEWYDDNRYRFWMNQDLNPTKGTFTRTITANNDLLDSKRAFLRTDNVNAKIKITNARVIKGDTVQPWSIAQEDLQGHSLTANVRMEGRYVNNITNNVKIFAEVYYDGQRVTNGYTLKIKHKGGNNTQWGAFYTRNYTENGEILQYDWGNKEQNGTPLEVIVLIDYKGMSTVATARMENIPDIVEIKEITKKYKTFESTIDRFDSTIGEVKQQVLANEEKRNLVLGSRMFNEKDYKLFGGSITRSVFQEYNGLPYMSMVSYEGNKHIWQGVGFNLSFSRIKKGERYSIRLPIRLSSALSLDLGAYVEIKNHLTRGILWNARLDVNNVQKDKWIEREFQFTADRDFDLGDGSFWIYIVRGGYINFAQPYMCEGDTLPKKYSPAPEDFYLQNSRIESSIIQTKEQIGLKVSKDEIISAINLSVEKDGNGQDAGLVKIDASRVDIRGALKAFQGDIGTFSIGGNKHTGYGKWITGVNQFQIGMSDGTNGALGTALWVNWGDKWDVEGKQSWYVMNNGAMIVNNRANINALYVTGDSYFARRLRAQGDGVDVGGSDVYGTASGIGTSVIWWSQIDDVKSSVSDERLKTNVNSTKVNALETLNNIEMVEFNWIKDGEFEKIGAIAQQVQSVEETLVVNDTSDKNNPSDYLRISYYNCIPYLIKAIQELSTENQQLKSQLQLMNERLTKLEEQLNGKL